MMKKILIMSLMLVVSSVLFAVTVANAGTPDMTVVENPQAVVDLVEYSMWANLQESLPRRIASR
jgi:hypothetical protein